MDVRRALRRADWLAEIQQILAVALVGVGAAGVVGLVLQAAGAPVDVPVGADTVLPRGVAPAGGLSLAPGATVAVRVEDPSPGQVVLNLLGLLPVWLVVMAMLFLLWRLVRLARRTDPFGAPVVRRLVVLGWVLVLGGPVAEVTSFLASFALADTVGHAQAVLTLMPLVRWMLIGFGVLAIAEVVRRGAALRAELDTVV